MKKINCLLILTVPSPTFFSSLILMRKEGWKERREGGREGEREEGGKGGGRKDHSYSHHSGKIIINIFVY